MTPVSQGLTQSKAKLIQFLLLIEPHKKSYSICELISLSFDNKYHGKGIYCGALFLLPFAVGPKPLTGFVLDDHMVRKRPGLGGRLTRENRFGPQLQRNPDNLQLLKAVNLFGMKMVKNWLKSETGFVLDDLHGPEKARLGLKLTNNLEKTVNYVSQLTLWDEVY